MIDCVELRVTTRLSSGIQRSVRIMEIAGAFASCAQIRSSKASYILEMREIWLVPFVNPDGYKANEACVCISYQTRPDTAIQSHRASSTAPALGQGLVSKARVKGGHDFLKLWLCSKLGPVKKSVNYRKSSWSKDSKERGNQSEPPSIEESYSSQSIQVRDFCLVPSFG